MAPTQRPPRPTRFALTGAALAALLLIASGLSARAAFAQAGETTAEPLSPQPTAEQLAPGLAVNYYFNYYQHLNEFNAAMKASRGMAGEPLTQLTHRTKTGNVLTSDKVMGVGCRIRGAINFPTTGTYHIRIESNDGVEVRIGDNKIWRDPDIHPNRWSPPLPFEIKQAGWYKLDIDYFQKKGTSALQMVWTPPGGTEEPVPPEAFAHFKE